MASDKKKYRIKGHESFILREGWLNKGLKVVKDNPLVFTDNYGADALGVGSSMAKAIRYWLKTANLIKDVPRKEISLTKIGELIYEKDPYFEDETSLWFVHVQIACNLEKATSWYMFFNHMDIEEFSKEKLYQILEKQIKEYAMIDELSSRSLNDDCSAILSMYCKEKTEDYDPEDKKISPFALLGLLKKYGNGYQKEQPNLKTLDKWVVFYLIQKFFIKKQTESVSIDDLLEKEEMPGKILNLKRMALNEYLEQLENLELISVNMTAGLDMVYKKSDLSEIEIIRKYYRQNEK